MAYDRDKVEAKAVKVIKADPNIICDADVIEVIAPGKTYYYDNKLNESDAIKAALLANKSQTAKGLRTKWRESDNPTLQIALYKIVCSDTDRTNLSSVSQSVVHSGETTVNVRKFSDAVKKVYGEGE